MGDNLPSRIILHGMAGVGKTSFAAMAPKPVFLMSPGETGVKTLINAKQIDPVPQLPVMHSWESVLNVIDQLTEQEHSYKTLVIDVLEGIEGLCHDWTCDNMYKSDWGPKGFMCYQAGYKSAISPWKQLLFKLDQLREKKLMGIIGLCHTTVSNPNNPEGDDYGRYVPAMRKETWEVTHGWADIVLFANYFVHVENAGDGRKAKGTGGSQRFIHTNRMAAYDAKNRHGLPDEIDMGESHKDSWGNFAAAMKAAKEQKGDEN